MYFHPAYFQILTFIDKKESLVMTRMSIKPFSIKTFLYLKPQLYKCLMVNDMYNMLHIH